MLFRIVVKKYNLITAWKNADKIKISELLEFIKGMENEIEIEYKGE